MRDRIYLGVWVVASLIVGYHIRWLHVEFDKYLDYKKPRSMLCEKGKVYEQTEPYSTVYVINENLTCMEKNNE